MYLDFYFNIGVLLGYLDDIALAHGEIDTNLLIVSRNELEHAPCAMICHMATPEELDYLSKDGVLLADERRITILVIRVHLKSHLATIDTDDDIRHPGHRRDNIDFLLVNDAMPLVELDALDYIKSVLHVKHRAAQRSTNRRRGEAAVLADLGNHLDCVVAAHAGLNNEGDIVDSAAIIGGEKDVIFHNVCCLLFGVC